MPLITGLKIIGLAFLCEYVDSTLGMGYGTLLTPFLLLMGFGPLQVVPCVLLSELCTGLLAGFTHHHAGNVNLALKSTNINFIVAEIKELGYIRAYKKNVPPHLRISLLLIASSFLGAALGVFVAVILPKFWLSLYIGFLVLVIGLVILFTLNKTYAFSARKIAALGLIASANKGLSGGGYGPLITAGQILSGVKTKSVVGITSFAEAITCFVGIIVYLLIVKNIDWGIAPFNTLGALLAVPVAAVSVKITREKKLKIFIGLTTIALGILTILKTLYR